jgi:hypothetical protein
MTIPIRTLGRTGGTSRIDHLQVNLEIAAKDPLPPELYEEGKRRLPIG